MPLAPSTGLTQHQRGVGLVTRPGERQIALVTRYEASVRHRSSVPAVAIDDVTGQASLVILAGFIMVLADPWTSPTQPSCAFVEQPQTNGVADRIPRCRGVRRGPIP